MIKRIWEVCEPHPDVFARDPDPSLFAASLHAVETGTADPDYTDPERFFNKTFMTESLERVLEGVLARLLSRPEAGAPILRLETPFGGGKTHTMVALYHLAQHPEAVEGTEAGERLHDALNLRALPRNIRVVVLDGAALNPQGREVEGLKIRTLWGELAYRLGGKALYETVQPSDEARMPPGQATLAEMLRSTGPTLILMDEAMHYLAKAMAVRVGDTNLSAQTMAFLRELTGAVAEVSQAVLVLSLPASSLEVPAEDRTRAEEMFQGVRKVVGRFELIETPVSQDEVFGVLRRRLFRRVGDERITKRTVDVFIEYYQEFARFFPELLRSPRYRERMLKAYPFHPEVVDLLYQRWGPHPHFQRTRGALRLMALVLRRLWEQRPGSAYLIQPHHIDLRDRHIRPEVVKLLDGGFDAIVTGDVVERAREIDRDLGGDYQREHLAEGAASCALLYSVQAGAERLGCTEEEMRVALLRPSINPAQVSEVLGRLRDRLWFLRYRDRRYFFTAKPNLNRVVLDFEEGVSGEEVEQGLRERLERAAGPGRGRLQVLVAPLEETVGEPSRATLILLPWRLGDTEAREWMGKVVGRTTARNLLIFLVPERAQEGALRVAVRRWLALQHLQRSRAFQELEPEDQEEVRRQVREKESEITGRLFSMYQRLFRPSGEGVEEVRVKLKQDGRTLAEAVAEALKERGILVESLSPEFLESHFEVKTRPVSLAEVKSALIGSPNMPIAADPKETLQEAILAGLDQGAFALRIGERVYKEARAVPYEALGDPTAVLIPPEEAVKEKPAPTPSLQRLEATSSGRNLYPLRQVLERVQGKDVTVSLIVEGSLADLKEDLERLLQDYSIPHTWDTYNP